LWNWIVGITTKTENGAEMSFNKIKNPAHKTLLEETQNFKTNAYHLLTASTIYKKKTAKYKQK
jgi:hypothetical protein